MLTLEIRNFWPRDKVLRSIAVVQRSWKDLAVENVENIFLTLQNAFESSVSCQNLALVTNG